MYRQLLLPMAFQITRIMIAISSVLAALAMGLAAFWVGSSAGVLSLLIVLGTGLLILALTSIARPSDKLNFRLIQVCFDLYAGCDGVIDHPLTDQG